MIELNPDSLGLMTQPSSAVAATEFDRTIAATPVEEQPGAFTVWLDDVWSSLVGVHGGYMCAVVVHAAESLAPGRTVRTLTTSFLRNGQVGPARVEIREVRQGRSMSTMVADMIQDDRILLTTRLTLLVPQTGIEWSDPSMSTLPPPRDCVRFEPSGRVSHFGRVDSAFDPDALPFTGDRARVAGYVRPLQERPVDSAWLAMATDWFPPPAFALVEPPTGGVSVDLTTHIHRSGISLGVDDWLVGSFEIGDSTGGLAVEHGRLTHMDGTVVAESFQTRLTTQRTAPLRPG